MSSSVGVQMDTVHIHLLLRVYVCMYVRVCERRRNSEWMGASMCRSVCTFKHFGGGKGKAGSYHQHHPIKMPRRRVGAGAEGDGKTKVTGRVGRECVSLQWEPVSGDASWPKLAGSCPSKWQQLLAVRESMSQSEEKSDGIYINTTLMAHLALRRVPGCAADS